MRQQLVCEKTLARIASKFDVGDFIHLGKGEETDCRTRPKVLADTLEAIVAAIFPQIVLIIIGIFIMYVAVEQKKKYY